MAPPKRHAAFDSNIEFSRYTSPIEYIAPPCSSSALLSLKVQFITFSGLLMPLYTAPPLSSAQLLVKVQFISVYWAEPSI